MSALRVEGAWTQASAPAVLANSARYLEAGHLDLSGVTRVDSAAVALLLELTRRAKAKGKPLVFSGFTPALGRWLEFFGIGPMLNRQ